MIKHLPHYGSIKTYHNYHEELLKWEGEYRRSRPNGGPFAKLHRSDDAYYGRYLDWYKGERVMAKHWKNGTLPKLRLNLLPNLQTIKTIGHGELAVIKREYNRKPVCRGKYLGAWGTYSKATRREIETMVPDDFGRDNIDAAHLELVINALNASGKQVQSLTLRHSKELLRWGSRFNTATMNLHGLRRLEINIDNNCEWNMIYLDREFYPIASWATKLKNLEELSVIQSVSAECYNIFLIIGDLHFPKLSKLSLDGARTTSKHLMDFVDVHRETLLSVSIKDAQMPPEQWTEFCAKERRSEWDAQGKELVLTHN